MADSPDGATKNLAGSLLATARNGALAYIANRSVNQNLMRSTTF
jgi:hypothetical protein